MPNFAILIELSRKYFPDQSKAVFKTASLVSNLILQPQGPKR